MSAGSSPEPRRVAVATFGRSDFSILRPLCRLLDANPSYEMGMWVGGAHFEEVSGRTVDEVDASGLPIWARIDGGTHDRSGRGTVEMMAAQLTGFAKALDVIPSQVPPDLVLILGDRYEAVAAGLAMVPLGVPVGHISGGSITAGAIDDVFRHCLTKIAAVHFCDLPRFARRIHYMGEPPSRIFTTGALGLDAFRDAATKSLTALVDQFGLGDLEPGFVLATLHPETRQPDRTRAMAEAMVEALIESGRHVVITYPNADPGSDEIVTVIEAAAAHERIRRVKGFGAEWYPTAMAHAGLVVGNSSAGIIEAASFGLPVVDIGDRQKGRERGPNVLHCERDRSAILDAIQSATSPRWSPRAQSGNIYGDGRGAERVMAALSSLDWSVLGRPKEFAEPDPSFDGALLELP